MLTFVSQCLNAVLVRGIAACFEAWYVGLNLIGTSAFGLMGAYWFDFGGDAEAASARRANLFIASLPIVFGGFAFMLADALAVKSAGRVRTRQLLLFAQWANLVRVLIKDRSSDTPVFEEVPMCLVYCTDTRSMAILCVQNACLFSLYVREMQHRA